MTTTEIVVWVCAVVLLGSFPMTIIVMVIVGLVRARTLPPEDPRFRSSQNVVYEPEDTVFYAYDKDRNLRKFTIKKSTSWFFFWWSE